MGAGHPEVLRSRYNLVELLAERGPDALSQVLPEYRARYGKDHQLTCMVAGKLKRLQEEPSTELQQNMEEINRTEEDQVVRIGTSALCNLAFDLRGADQTELAKQLYEHSKGMWQNPKVMMKLDGVIKLAFHCEGVGLLEWKEWLLQEVGDATENMVARVADVASASTSAGASASSRFDPELEQGDPGHESVMGEASRLAELGFAAT